MKIWDSKFFQTKIKEDDVCLKEMALGYFLGPLLVMMLTCVVSTYYLTYYRTYDDVVASRSFLTLLPLLSVIPMVIANIVVGVLLGKTKTAAGKARPYILLATPLIPVSGLLVFLIPNLSLGFRLIWMVITFNLFSSVANPIYGTAHFLMVSLSTRNLDQRGKLSVVANIPAVAANGLISSIVMPVILSWINSAADTAGVQSRWHMIMTAFAVLAFIGCLLEYFFTRERITEEDLMPEKGAKVDERKTDNAKKDIPALTQLKSAAKDRFWIIIMVFYILYQAGVMFKGGYIFNIYCHEFFSEATVFGISLSADMIQSVLALISGIPLAAGMLFIWPLANKFGKKNMVVLGCVLSVIGSIICVTDPSNFTVVLIGQTVKGFSSIPGAYVMMALFADVLDHLEAKLGYRVDGVTMSCYNTIITVINGLAVAVFNYFYDSGLFSQADVAEFFFLKFEIGAQLILIVVMSFLTVEKTIVQEQELIAKRKSGVE